MKIKPLLIIFWLILPTGITGNWIIQSSSQTIDGDLIGNLALTTKEQAAVVLCDNSVIMQYNEQNSKVEGFPQGIENLAIVNRAYEVTLQGNVHMSLEDAIKYAEESQNQVPASCKFVIHIPNKPNDNEHKNPKEVKNERLPNFAATKYLDDLTTGGSLDFGDAPEPHPTYLRNNGARHVIKNEMHLGRYIDSELDGQPDHIASGDDNNGTDDEDGVSYKTSLIPGKDALVEVIASQPGFLSAWIDFNCDGDWSDTGEKIISNQPLISGTNSLSFLVPMQAKSSNTFSRFRFSTERDLSYEGLAPDGEVEDYLVNIKKT